VPALAWVRVIPAVALLAGGCGGSAPTSTETFGDLQHAYERQAALEYAALEDDMTACLLGAGYESSEVRAVLDTAGLRTDGGSSSGSEVDRLHGLDEEARVRSLGFGFAPVALLERQTPSDDVESAPDSQSLDDLSPSLVAAFESCATTIGYLRPAPSTTEFSRVAADVGERVRADPEAARLGEAWADCLASHGYDVSSPDALLEATALAFATMQQIDPTSVDIALVGGDPAAVGQAELVAQALYGSADTWEDLAALEIAVAVQEFECRDEVGYEAGMAEIRDRVVDEGDE
jgi:hypothetical protein